MKTQLTLNDVFNLASELEGLSITDSQSGKSEIVIKGLLNNKLSIVIKYHLHKLLEKLNIEKKNFISIRDQLDPTLKEEDKKAEIAKLAEETVDIEHYDFKIEDFNSLETEEYYFNFFSKIIK